jgi:hypothetical protein
MVMLFQHSPLARRSGSSGFRPAKAADRKDGVRARINLGSSAPSPLLAELTVNWVLMPTTMHPPQLAFPFGVQVWVRHPNHISNLSFSRERER